MYLNLAEKAGLCIVIAVVLFVPYSEGVGRQAPEKTAADDDQVVDGTEFSDL